MFFTVFDRDDEQVYATLDRSIIGVFWRLLKSFVVIHFVFDCGQEVFQSCGFLPVFEEGEVVYSTIALVDTGQITFVIEF